MSPQSTAPARPVMPMKKRLILALVIVVITVVPALIMLAVTYAATGQVQAAATWASIPAIAGLAAAATAGRRFAVIVAIVLGLLAPLSIVAGASPVSGAALMAVLSIEVGRLSRFGLHKSAMLVPVMLAWSLINPPPWAGQTSVDRLDETYLLWMAAIFFVGGVFPALVVPFLMRKRPKPQLKSYSRSDATPYTVIITVLVTVSTYAVLSNPKWYGGAFLIAAIFILAPIGDAQTLRPTILRILGTLIGSVFLLLLLPRIDSLTVIYLFGLLFIVIALVARFGRYGWIYYVFMMPATAALNATTLAQVGQLGEQRAVDNLVGGVLVLIASVIAMGYSHWAQRHGHVSDADPEADGLSTAEASAPSPA
jgi:MFS family permease